MADAADLKELNRKRMEDLRAKKQSVVKASGVAEGPDIEGEAKPKRVKKEKVEKPCGCGCGGQTTAFFVPGHDARFKGWLLRIEKGLMEVKELPVAIQKKYQWKKRGKGVIPTTNYKGQPHTGYLADEDVVETE